MDTLMGDREGEKSVSSPVLVNLISK